MLTLLLLYQNGYEVGKYISLEKKIEDTSEVIANGPSIGRSSILAALKKMGGGKRVSMGLSLFLCPSIPSSGEQHQSAAGIVPEKISGEKRS